MSVSAGPTATEPAGRAGRARTALATVCISGTLEDKLAAAAAAGFDGVEIFEPDLVASPLVAGPAARPVRRPGPVDRPLPAVPRLRRGRPGAAGGEPAPGRAQVRHHGSELGTDLILVCSSVSPDALDDDDGIAEQLHTLAARAAERGLRVSYEALAWGRYVNTYERSWEIVRRADHPALGLCVDSFHILSRGSDPAGIRDIPGEKLFFLQLADAPHMDMDVLQWSRHHRLFPGQGAWDLPAFLDHVLTAGYTGPLSLEVFNDVFRQSDPRRSAVDALRSLLALQEATLAAAGRADPAAGGGDRAAADPAAGRVRVHRAGHRRRRHGGAGAGRARLRAHRAAPVQAGAAVAAGRGPGAAQRVRPGRVRTGRPPAPRWPRWASRPPTRPRPPSGPRRCSPRCCRAPADRPRPTSPRWPRRTAPRSSSCAPAADEPARLAGRLRPDRPGRGRRRRDRDHRGRPRRADPAVRPLRRGRAVLPLGARPARRSTRRRWPRRSGWCATARWPTRR